MNDVRAHFRLRFYAALPEDEDEADAAFDAMEEAVLAVLNREQFAGSGIVAESFSVIDGDTEVDA